MHAATAVNHIEFRGPLMVVRFPEPRVCWSWAIVNGSCTVSPAVAWYFLQSQEYPELCDARTFLRDKLQAADLSDAVGLLTSRKRYGQVETTASHSGMRASCVATVGLSNGMRVGDGPTFIPSAGTINLLCEVDARLSDECALEALSIAAEARTAAVIDATGATATGTGTDCIVLAHATSGELHTYAGKHTVIGYVIGRAVYDAVLQGVNEWRGEFRP
jgi:adenosylcobinamide amidohydrolase